MSDQDVEQLYRQLKSRFQAGEITIYQFRTEMVRAKLRDKQGRFWTLDAETGRWIVNAGGSWIEGKLPPELVSAPAAPAPAASADWVQSMRPAPTPEQPASAATPADLATASVKPRPRPAAAGLSRSQMLILILLFIGVLVVFCLLGAVLTNGYGLVNLGL